MAILESPAAEAMILNIADLEEAGSSRLSKANREYLNSGAHQMSTLRENVSVFNKYRLRPRVLVDVSNVNTTTRVFGDEVSFPLCVAPSKYPSIIDRHCLS
jgi:(S)-2-hydroxy-acid oxidase